MYDREGIIDHLRELNEALEDWKRYQSVSLEQLKSDRDKKNMVLHTMLISIQASIDIANHLIAERKLRKPSTYREVFEILSESNIIQPELSTGLADLAGFRNIIIHIYWRLDLEEVYSILQKELEILKEFKKTMKGLLQLHSQTKSK